MHPQGIRRPLSFVSGLTEACSEVVAALMNNPVLQHWIV